MALEPEQAAVTRSVAGRTKRWLPKNVTIRAMRSFDGDWSSRIASVTSRSNARVSGVRNTSRASNPKRKTTTRADEEPGDEVEPERLDAGEEAGAQRALPAAARRSSIGLRPRSSTGGPGSRRPRPRARP